MEEKEVTLTLIPGILGIVNNVLNFVVNHKFEIPIKIFAYVHYKTKKGVKNLNKTLKPEKIEKIK